MSSNIQVQRICQYCSNEFTARTTTTLYCSHKCNSAAYKARLRDTKIEESNKQKQPTQVSFLCKYHSNNHPKNLFQILFRPNGHILSNLFFQSYRTTGISS